MKIWIDGVARDMPPQEEADYIDAQEHADSPDITQSEEMIERQNRGA